MRFLNTTGVPTAAYVSTSLGMSSSFLKTRCSLPNLDSEWLFWNYSRNRPPAKISPIGKVNTSLRIKTSVANGETRMAGILPNRSLIDGIHSKEVDRKSKYPSSRRSHLLFSIFSPNKNPGRLSRLISVLLIAMSHFTYSISNTIDRPTFSESENLHPLTFAL